MPEAWALVLRRSFGTYLSVFLQLILRVQFAGVFFVLSGLGKVAVACFQQRILIAVAALPGERDLGLTLSGSSFHHAFAFILIAVRSVCHAWNDGVGADNVAQGQLRLFVCVRKKNEPAICLPAQFLTSEVCLGLQRPHSHLRFLLHNDFAQLPGPILKPTFEGLQIQLAVGFRHRCRYRIAQRVAIQHL